MANPPPAMDPVKGQAAMASLPPEVAGHVREVPNSQDDDIVLNPPPTMPAGTLASEYLIWHHHCLTILQGDIALAEQSSVFSHPAFRESFAQHAAGIRACLA